MNRRSLLIIGLLLASGLAFSDDREQDQVEISKAGESALTALYKAQPSARKAVESAAGYAAFSNMSMKIFLAGGGTGKGIAVDNRTKHVTYMRMGEIQAGLGRQEIPAYLGIRERKGVERLHQRGIRAWRASHRGGQSRRSGRRLSGSRRRVAGGLALSAHRHGSGSGADRQGDQVLQGPGFELTVPALMTFALQAV